MKNGIKRDGSKCVASRDFSVAKCGSMRLDMYTTDIYIEKTQPSARVITFHPYLAELVPPDKYTEILATKMLSDEVSHDIRAVL